MVIEKISGTTYNTYVVEHFVKPLALQNTGPDYTDEINDRLVTGYTRRETRKTRLPIAHINTGAMASATGFYSTAQDMCAYFAAHAVGSGKLLDDESKKEMQRVHFRAKIPGQKTSEDYGLGLVIEYLKKRKIIGHSGGFPGHRTQSMADSKDELVVVALTNCIDSPAGIIVKGIYTIFDYFQENTPITKPTQSLAHLEGRYMNLWSMTDIVVTGDKVIAANPDSWQPFVAADELEYVDDSTLKVIATDSFSAEQELVHFNIHAGKVKDINYNGGTMFPEAEWIKKQSQKSKVELSPSE